jgi:DNA-binding transcriptional MerR regulator
MSLGYDINGSTGGDKAAQPGVYSIGAVASMLKLPRATLRTWEERYGVISPARTPAGHRLYTRDQVDQLRFVSAAIERGMSAADGHRLLAERAGRAEQGEKSEVAPNPRMLVLVAERDRYSAELIEFLLRAEGFGVDVALDMQQAKRRFQQTRPDLIVVELLVAGGSGDGLCRWLKERASAAILSVSSLAAADRALQAGADAFLIKPFEHLELVSTVKDLLGISALLPPGGIGTR